MNFDVENTINEYKMLENTTGVVLALSGGSDSMCLLDILVKILARKNISLCCVHINHCLRDKAADEDEQFVRQQCKNRNLDIYVKKINVKDIAKNNKKGIEETAREVRYGYLSEVIKITKYNKIATAHNLNDSIETTILNLSRGTGVKGLVGIPPIRENIIRPLIFTSKQEIEQYCSTHNIPFVIDKTNFECDYSRNKVRNKVIPVLEEINKNLLQNYRKTIEILKKDNDYISSIAKIELEKAKISDNILDLEIFMCVDEAVKFRVLASFIKDVRQKEIDFNKFNEILYKIKLYNEKNIPQKIQLSKKCFIKIIYKQIVLYDEIKSKPYYIPLHLGDNIIGNKIIKIEKELNINNLATNFAINFDILNVELIARNRLTSDKISMIGRSTKTLKKFMIENKIPEYTRNSILILADKNSNIVYAEKIGIDKKYSVDENSKNKLYISIGAKSD